MSSVHWRSAIDFLVLVVAIYFLLRWSREARALRLTLAILALRVGALLARQLDLLITSWVLDAATIVALLVLAVVFQPEVRRALMRLDVRSQRGNDADVAAISAAGAAAWALAGAGCGALIVIVRRDSLSELITTGVQLDGQVSAEVLEAIFQKSSPVHDGAAVIDGDRIVRVSAILPLTQRTNVPEEYGTRHRAAMGVTERSDALAIVVSEERREVTVMWEGHSRKMTGVASLESTLAGLTDSASHTTAPRIAFRGPELGLKAAALALAGLVWSVTFLFPGRSVREQTVPVEFTNVPARMTIVSQSTDRVQVWLRGTDFLFDSVDLDALVVRCDLAGAHEGANAIPFHAGSLNVPFGMTVEGMTPREVRVSLKSQ
jgi:uncharacterized protein (TIGR00159 family)